MVALSGTAGVSPDPLAFAIEEAHKRRLELHACESVSCRGSRQRPSAAESRRPQTSRAAPIWKSALIDPGEPVARNHAQMWDYRSRQALPDRRSALDDYFYPYPLRT
jgi:uncharacterized lipoprotein YddW (UPF0748 family)